MKNKTTDRRIRKTKNAIKNGLAELLLEKSIGDVSVRELTEKVDLNRGTFYLHYKDIFDLVEQIETEMFEELQYIIDSHPAKEMNGEPLPLLEDIFNFLKENSIMATALISKNGDIAFVNKLKYLIKEKCFCDWEIFFNKNKNDDIFNYFYNYLVSGCIGLFETWLNNGLKETPKEMAIIAQDFMLNGIKSIK